jgi:hypothetical protein
MNTVRTTDIRDTLIITSPPPVMVLTSMLLTAVSES